MLAAAILAALPELRAHAESMMLDAGTIARPGSAVDELTGAATWTTVYAGKMQIDSPDAQWSNPETVGSQATVQRYTVKVPVGSYAPAVGDRVTVTASRLDQQMVGRKYRVKALLHKTAATAYRLGVEEVL